MGQVDTVFRPLHSSTSSDTPCKQAVLLQHPCHKLPRTEHRRKHGQKCVRLRIHHSSSYAGCALLFADGQVLSQEMIERSDLLLDMLHTEGETVIPLLTDDWSDWLRWEPNADLASHFTPQRLLDMLQVATFLIDDKMAANVSRALAQSLRVAIRNYSWQACAVESSPAMFSTATPMNTIHLVIDTLSNMKDDSLAEVLQHLHLSELLHCPESLQALAVTTRVSQAQSRAMLRQQLACHPRYKDIHPPLTSSKFSQYAQYIQHLQVKQLDLRSNCISAADVPQLAAILAALSVQSLDLRDNPIDDSSGAFCDLIKHCMQQELLDVRVPASVLSTTPESVALGMFGCMHRLLTLDISGSILTEAMCTALVGSLGHMSSLQKLGLWGVTLWGQGGTRASTMVISDRPRDPRTGVPVCSMHEHVRQVFNKLQALTCLEIGPTTAHLRNAGATDAVLMSLPTLPNLQSLRICVRHVSCPHMFMSLSQLSDLGHLTVQNTPCLAALLTPLRQCSSLCSLHAQRCVSRSLSHGALACLTQLDELHLDLLATTQDVLEGIAWQLQALPQLRHLDVVVGRTARWQHDWLPALHSLAVSALHALPALTALELPPCDGSSMRMLARALRSLPVLQHLSLLRRNRDIPLQETLLAAEPQELQELGCAISSLPRLSVLELPFANLHACACIVSDALAPMATLTRLVLAVASTAPEAAQDSQLVADQLGAAIARQQGLCELSLQFPQDSSSSLVALVPYFGRLGHLQWLEMQGMAVRGSAQYLDAVWEQLKALPLHRGVMLH